MPATATDPANATALAVFNVSHRRPPELRQTSPGKTIAFAVVLASAAIVVVWAVATRPPGPPPAGRNGLGMAVAQAGHWLRFFRRRFTLLPDREELSMMSGWSRQCSE
jgi:hypothetical protein